MPPIRLVAVTIAVAVSASAMISPPRAVAADSVIKDPRLQACINETELSRDAATPITVDDLVAVTSLSCNATYAPIASLDGVEHLDSAFALFFYSSLRIGDLSPIGGMAKVNRLVIQNYVNTPAVIDLSELEGAADTLKAVSAIPTGFDASTPPPTRITGLASLPLIDTLYVPNSRLVELDGIEALSSLRDLRVGFNQFDAGFLASLPRSADFFMLNITGNRINDFSALPPLVGTLYAENQRHVSDEVLLKSADEDTLVADPGDRAVAWPGGVARHGDSPDIGPLAFAAEDLLTPAEAAEHSLGADTSQYDLYATYDWTVAEGRNGDSVGARAPSKATGATFFPVVEVAQVDRGHEVTARTAVDLHPVSFEYSSGRLDAEYAPNSLVIDGELPRGLDFDTMTGRISGTTTQTGRYAFTVQATDANDVTTEGVYELTVSPMILEIPPRPGIDNPAGPANATWVVPDDSAHLSWTVTDDGRLIAHAAEGAVFTDGSTAVDYAAAPDDDTVPAPSEGGEEGIDDPKAPTPGEQDPTPAVNDATDVDAAERPTDDRVADSLARTGDSAVGMVVVAFAAALLIAAGAATVLRSAARGTRAD